MGIFRVALSDDFLNPDGTPAYPSFDLSPLEENPDVEYDFIPVVDNRISAEAIAGYDALILLTARFDAESFASDNRLSVIARFGVGYDTVDVEACDRHGVALAIAPNGVRRPVAVSIMTLMLALAGQLMMKDKLTREGPSGWDRRSDYMGTGLVGRTLGSIGIGNIGAELFRLARPFDMKFIAHDPYADKAVVEELGVELVDLEDVFRRSDFLSFNCPLTPETNKLVNAGRLALMKPDAFLINTARGPIVDQDALYEVLRDRKIAGAALDVFEAEPNNPDDPLFALDNVIVTPHSLCFTDQCFTALGADDVRAVLAVMSGEAPVGLVNPQIVDNDLFKAKLTAYRDAFG